MTKTTEQTVSAAFRSAFESHHDRHTDPALALQAARETASVLVPAGVTGSFDDETLTFTDDETMTTSTSTTATLTTFARQTAADNSVDYQTAVRQMRDEPHEVALATGIDVAAIILWCNSAPSAELPNVRIFRGDETRQVDASGHPADHEKWYYEPADYEGDLLWSRGYGSRAEAYHAAGCSAE